MAETRVITATKVATAVMIRNIPATEAEKPRLMGLGRLCAVFKEFESVLTRDCGPYFNSLGGSCLILHILTIGGQYRIGFAAESAGRTQGWERCIEEIRVKGLIYPLMRQDDI